MSKGNSKAARARKAMFISASKSIRIRVKAQFNILKSREASWNSAVFELGKSLEKLQGMCEDYGQSFRTVVADAKLGINMNVRTAYRIIKQYENAKGLPARTVALCHSAGFDHAAARVQTKLRKLGNAKVNNMTSVELAAALKRTRTTATKSVSPKQRFLNAWKGAVEAYAAYLKSVEDKDGKMTQAEVDAAIAQTMSAFKYRGLHIVAKAA
jgi:hypothetical protein